MILSKIRDRWRDVLGPGVIPSLVFTVFFTLLTLGLPILWRALQVWRRSKESEPGPAELILVLGRTLQEDRPTRVFLARLARGAELWRVGLAPRVFVAGGLTGGATRTEADAGIEVLEQSGVPSEVLVAEGRSRHTLENLIHVRSMLECPPTGRLLIVSDPIHTARVAAYAKGLRLNCRFAPALDAAPRGVLGRWARIFHEAIFLHWYHCGVLYSRLTRNAEYLARVT